MISTLTRVDEDVLLEIEEEKRVRMTSEVFLLFAMGSQFDHLIAVNLERLGVFCLVADPAQLSADDVRKVDPKGIIISGGPASVLDEPPPFSGQIFNLGIPVLGICLGFQMWAKHIGCTVSKADKREFGVHALSVLEHEPTLFAGCGRHFPVLESHGDRIEIAGGTPLDEVLAATENAEAAAGNYRHLWGVQFHPEVSDTKNGPRIFENFCFGICGASCRFPSQDVAQSKIEALRNEIQDGKVLLALSGGSDSSTVAYLLRAAIGDRRRLRGIYIKGIDRPDDMTYAFKNFGLQEWIDFKVVDATDRFLDVLAGKKGMHEKRVAMRGVYKEVLEAEAREFGAGFIAQGTLYTDICESGGGYQSGARKARIKLHHNTNLGFSLPELAPLSDCVKDMGRGIGRTIGVPEELLVRHPFPGPGLIVRIIGEVTAERLRIARQLDNIFIEELRRGGFYESTWQAGVALTDCVTTCTKGDDAVEGAIVIVWAVASVNGFTARAIDFPPDFLRLVSRRMTNEIREVGAVTYRISDKPPATIEVG